MIHLVSGGSSGELLVKKYGGGGGRGAKSNLIENFVLGLGKKKTREKEERGLIYSNSPLWSSGVLYSD